MGKLNTLSFTHGLVHRPSTHPSSQPIHSLLSIFSVLIFPLPLDTLFQRPLSRDISHVRGLAGIPLCSTSFVQYVKGKTSMLLRQNVTRFVKDMNKNRQDKRASKRCREGRKASLVLVVSFLRFAYCCLGLVKVARVREATELFLHSLREDWSVLVHHAGRTMLEQWGEDMKDRGRLTRLHRRQDRGHAGKLRVKVARVGSVLDLG